MLSGLWLVMPTSIDPAHNSVTHSSSTYSKQTKQPFTFECFTMEQHWRENTFCAHRVIETGKSLGEQVLQRKKVLQGGASMAFKVLPNSASQVSNIDSIFLIKYLLSIMIITITISIIFVTTIISWQLKASSSLADPWHTWLFSERVHYSCHPIAIAMPKLMVSNLFDL